MIIRMEKREEKLTTIYFAHGFFFSYLTYVSSLHGSFLPFVLKSLERERASEAIICGPGALKKGQPASQAHLINMAHRSRTNGRRRRRRRLETCTT